MRDKENSQPGPEAEIGKRKGETPTLENMEELLRKMILLHKDFERVAKSMGYVSARALREKRRRERRKQIRQMGDLLAEAIQLVRLLRLRGSQK